MKIERGPRGLDDLNPSEFGRRVGRSSTWVRDRCRLTELTPQIPGAYRLQADNAAGYVWRIPVSSVAGIRAYLGE